MSRISRYQEGILKFIKLKGFVNETSATTKNILNELIELSDHIPAILCLTILNHQCKKYDIKIHGYYIASGIDILMLVAKICSNRDYYDDKYGNIMIDNMIMEAINLFYKCITQNIDTLRMSKNGNINSKISQLCIEYSTKYIPNITEKKIYESKEKMKKTDLFCLDMNSDNYSQYKKKYRLDIGLLSKDAIQRYGSVCKLALSLAWILGQGDDGNISKLKDLCDDTNIVRLEKLGEYVGKFLKIYDDFLYIDRDIAIGKYSMSYVMNYGIKEAYSELIESKANFIEGSMILGIDTKTCREIIDMIVKRIDEIVKDVSVDMDTQYDDVSTTK